MLFYMALVVTYWSFVQQKKINHLKLLRGFKQTSELSLGSVATIGNFDGVHRGHQALLASLRVEASRLQLPMVVVLFEPQPCEYFQGQQAPARLSRLREKLDILRQCGVDYVYCLTFNKNLAGMLPTVFAERVIFSRLGVKYLLIGNDFCFGRDRLGNVGLLNELGRKWSCIVKTRPDYQIENERVSSTKVRHALQLGQFDVVTALLGRTYSMCGRVIHGDGVGRQWGVPTANLTTHSDPLPLKGVFCVQVKRDGKSLLTGVANLGNRPTRDGTKNRLEVHLFDFDESIYGEMIQVFFLHKLRDEIKFSSVDVLIAQIHHDVAAAKTYFMKPE